MMSESVLFFGFGYTATFTAELLSNQGYRIYGTSRDTTKILKFNQLGYYIIGFTHDQILKILPKTTHLIVSVPPDNQTGDPVLFNFVDLIARTSYNLKSIIYLSSTGVYGDHQGGWVNEETPASSTNSRGQLRLKAENDWLEFGNKNNITLKIFRLSAIYGPERNSLIQIKNGTAQSIFKEGQVFSRIHVKDIANITKAALTKPNIGGIFNLCDDQPCSTIEVDNYAAQLLGIPAPAIIDFASAKLSPMAKEFYSSNRRIRNNKIKEILGVKLLFPDYKSGLRSILDNK